MSNLPEINNLQDFEGVSKLPRKFDLFFEIELFVSIVFFGAVPYFVLVHVPYSLDNETYTKN